jgi:TRAP-type C4-dicarboxylate transport system permease small subunit
MNAQIVVYGAYSIVAVGLIGWLARNLGRHGSTFLEDVFPDKPQLAKAVNQLLVTGFFMLNLGYAAWLLKADRAADATAGFELLARKLGTLLISLALIHFCNVLVFWKIRRSQHRMAHPIGHPAAPAGPIYQGANPAAPAPWGPAWTGAWPATGAQQ